MGQRTVAEKEQRIFFDQLWAELSDASNRDLGVAELGESRNRGNIEACPIQANDPVDLID